MATTVLISDDTDKLILEARQKLLHAGMSHFDRKLVEFIQEKFDFEKESALTKGAVVAIAVATLLYLLPKDP